MGMHIVQDQVEDLGQNGSTFRYPPIELNSVSLQVSLRLFLHSVQTSVRIATKAPFMPIPDNAVFKAAISAIARSKDMPVAYFLSLLSKCRNRASSSSSPDVKHSSFTLASITGHNHHLPMLTKLYALVTEHLNIRCTHRNNISRIRDSLSKLAAAHPKSNSSSTY